MEYSSKEPTKNQEIVFGSSIYRNSDRVDDFISIDGYLDEFIKFDIHKIFGLNIKEFLELTLQEKNKLLLNAIKVMKDKEAITREITKDIESDKSHLTTEELLGGIGV